MNQSYDPEDSDFLDEAIKNILKMGGLNPEEVEEHDELCDNCSGMSNTKKQQIINCTNAHNNTKDLCKFINDVSAGNGSVKMRCSAYAMDILEGFQDLVDTDRHVGSPTLRAVIAAFVAKMLAEHANKVIEGINSGEDQVAIKALNMITEISTPLSDEELQKLKDSK